MNTPKLTDLADRTYWPAYKNIMLANYTDLPEVFFAVDQNGEVDAYRVAPTQYIDNYPACMWLHPWELDPHAYLVPDRDLLWLDDRDIFKFNTDDSLRDDWNTTLIHRVNNKMYWCINDEKLEII